jgi:Uma2 family endonuclease
MATGTWVSVEEYLHTDYSPDRDYVDGVVLERNLGEYDHGKLQMAVAAWFYARRRELGIHVVPELRVQVSPTRFRIPDVCVIAGAEPDEQILTKAPFICIEILSPKDRLNAQGKRGRDFVSMGVAYVWILDPRTRKAYRVTPAALDEVVELRTENPEIVVPLAELFE